jgi:hypothetical protein
MQAAGTRQKVLGRDLSRTSCERITNPLASKKSGQEQQVQAASCRIQRNSAPARVFNVHQQ